MSLTADDLLWNWTWWQAQGESVGNMDRYLFEDEEEEKSRRHRLILEDQARQVDALFRRLPHHERMIITAEYPQKNVRFGGMPARQRQQVARRWIANVTFKLYGTAISLSDLEYKLYLGLFKDKIDREVER